MQKIILDTDPGIDDAQAIAFAIAHPNIELLGLTTVFGNADIELTTRNALTILEKFDTPNIPVARGAAAPLKQERYPAPDFVHGADGLGNLNLSLPENQALQESAAAFIVRLANEQPGEISLVAVGPLTNIAQAVALDPQLPNKVKELVVMGGAVNEPGNVTPLAEANLFNDPHAADEVFAHDWPAFVIGLDVTLQTLLHEEDLTQIREHCGAAGAFLWDSAQFYLDFYSNRLSPDDPSYRACAMHDASALVYLVERDAFEFVTGPARVISEGIAVGQLSIDEKREPYLLPHWETRPNINAAIRVDSSRIRTTFKQTLSSHNFT